MFFIVQSEFQKSMKNNLKKLKTMKETTLDSCLHLSSPNHELSF
jgi:hypothetical protein